MSCLIDEPALTRTLLRILRHAAGEYGVQVDEAGWAEVGNVAQALRRCRRAWSGLEIADLRQLVTELQADRIELTGDRLRARYGHSLPLITLPPAAAPPMLLYHGTQRGVVDAILLQGLKPQGRLHVHLTSERDYALRVAAAKGDAPLILRVHAQAAYAAGNRFWRASRHVWLTGAIDACYLAVEGSYGL